MSECKKFTRDFVGELRQDIEQALAPIEAAYGISFEIGTFRFTDRQLGCRLSAVVNDTETADDEPNSVVAETFRNKAIERGFSPGDLGRTFKNSEGKECKLVGMKTRASKYPMVVIEVATGTRYRYTERTVKLGLGI